ncbi:hepatoma-derived growth factor-related protein 2 [Iris pallida]|uniref:Hepatoma-derived growth factor-related protein 2 n=1 Tax=Iris pallida TaxID=29817 RepID=A0AAX6IAM4_IRIPA|nr:hepatoma-derived growth factor-related protein 2 [Iris pallida]
MQSHYKTGMNRRGEEYYEQEDYDDYEDDEEDSEEEEEEEEEEPEISKEQQEFLSLREQIKEKIRQKLKKQSATAFGRQSQVNKKTMTNDKFGSFFGPSQPVIASRVLDERRSILETNHTVSRIPSSTSGSIKGPASTTSEKKAHAQQVKVISEVKRKAQTLKDMRDYSFLLSDDADFPVSDKEQQQQQQQPAVRKPAPNSDGRSAQASLKVKPPMGKHMPARPVPNGHKMKPSFVKNLQSKTRVDTVKGAVMSRSRPVSSENRKVVGGNGSSRPVGHKPLPSKVSSTPTGANRPAKVVNDPTSKKKVLSAVPHSSSQKNAYSEQKRRPSERMDEVRPAQRQTLPLSKPQMKPSQKIPARDGRGDQLKKKPKKRRIDEDEDEGNPFDMIRKMFKYDPNKYAGRDEGDDRCMEAGFHQIQKEEEYSSKMGFEEDEVERLKLEEEERKVKMRKKQKLLRQRERNL